MREKVLETSLLGKKRDERNFGDHLIGKGVMTCIAKWFGEEVTEKCFSDHVVMRIG